MDGKFLFLSSLGEVKQLMLIDLISLPVLFWSQVLGFIMVIIATFCPNYASFTAFRTLQGFVATSPQVIGLSVVHDLFFFHGKHTPPPPSPSNPSYCSLP